MRRMAAFALAAVAAAAVAAAAGESAHRKLAAAGIGANVYPRDAAGETAPLPRMYEGAPPQIPHDTADLAITRKDNPCLDCHREGTEVAPGHRATAVPASHRVDPRTGETGREIAGARWMCVVCHVPQAAASPPVASTRRGAPK